MASRQAHPRTERHKVSIRRRLLVLGLAVGAAALQIYLTRIPLVINLPQDDVDAQTLAKADNARIEIDQPAVPESGLLLSYSGQSGEVADLHFENAIVDPSNANLQSSLKPVGPAPARVGYVSLPAVESRPQVTSPPPAGDTCHTFVEVRRAQGSSPIASLNIFLVNGSADNEQRRELRVWTQGGTLDVQIHTDPPPAAETSHTPFSSVPGCSKMLQVSPLDNNSSAAPVDAPLLPAPVRLRVPDVKGQKASSPANTFRIGLTPAFAEPLKWRSADDLFTGVSLGETALECKQLRVLPLYLQNGERLKIRAAGRSDLVLDQLGFSLNTLRLRVSGRSWVEINGEPLGFNLMRFLKENPILSGVLALVNAAILLLVKQTFFARVEAAPEADDAD